MEQPYYGEATNKMQKSKIPPERFSPPGRSGRTGRAGKNQKYNKGQVLRYNSGQAALITVVLLLFVSLVIGSGVSAIALKESRVSTLNMRAKESYFLAESSAEDALYRVRKNMNYSATETLTLNTVTVTTTITDIGGNEKKIIAQGDSAQAIRNIDLRLKAGAGTSFAYGAQIGNGGLVMENTSKVNGSVYSNGVITGNNSPTITGDALLAGASTISGVTVGGTTQTGLTPISMPISDTQLDTWETDAQAGGIISSPCPYKPANGSSLGPIKIDCDLEIDGTKIVTLTGALWVKGNINLKNSAQLVLSSSFGSSSGIVIAHDSSNPTNKGVITVQNSAQVLGSGTTGSYVLIVSRNTSAEQGGGTEAIEIKNSSTAPIYYAPHGLVAIENNSNLKEVTAYKLHLKNSAQVTYETGLANAFFSSGPAGGWEILDWREVK